MPRSGWENAKTEEPEKGPYLPAALQAPQGLRFKPSNLAMSTARPSFFERARLKLLARRLDSFFCRGCLVRYQLSSVTKLQERDIFLPQAPLRPYRSPVTKRQVKTEKNREPSCSQRGATANFRTCSQSTSACQGHWRSTDEHVGGPQPATRAFLFFVSGALVGISCRRSQLPVRKTKAK